MNAFAIRIVNEFNRFGRFRVMNPTFPSIRVKISCSFILPLLDYTVSAELYDGDNAGTDLENNERIDIYRFRGISATRRRNIMRIELVQSLADLHGGRGGYWEDRGCEWYAVI
jgi:hypothetical protein